MSIFFNLNQSLNEFVDGTVIHGRNDSEAPAESHDHREDRLNRYPFGSQQNCDVAS